MDKPAGGALPPSLVADGILMAALAHWAANRSGSALPGPELVDPLRLPRRILPYIILTDFIGERIYYRLVGTIMCERWGADITGKYLDEIMSGEYADFMRGLYLRCREAGHPLFSESKFRWDIGRILLTRRLMLPFRGEPEGAVRMMVVQTFGGEAPCDGPRTVSVLLGHWEPETAAVILDSTGNTG